MPRLRPVRHALLGRQAVQAAAHLIGHAQQRGLRHGRLLRIVCRGLEVRAVVQVAPPLQVPAQRGPAHPIHDVADLPAPHGQRVDLQVRRVVGQHLSAPGLRGDKRCDARSLDARPNVEIQRLPKAVRWNAGLGVRSLSARNSAPVVPLELLLGSRRRNWVFLRALLKVA